MEYFLINHILLRKYNFHDHKSVATPFDSSVHLFPVNNDDEIFKQKDYASIIGSLRYATDCTRSDIAYAVGVLSRFTSKLSKDHWLAIERVMRYLIGTKNYGLFYKKYLAVIEDFSDADWNTLSDPFTKALAKDRVWNTSRGMGLKSI